MSKIKITRKNRQYKFETTVENVALLIKLLRLLLDLRHLDRLGFTRNLSGLIIKAVLLTLNFADEHYEPVIIPTVQIACRRILKHGPPSQSLLTA